MIMEIRAQGQSGSWLGAGAEGGAAGQAGQHPVGVPHPRAQQRPRVPGVDRAWKRIALVTGIEWMRHLTDLVGWMTPGETKTFPLAQLDEATAWAAA